MAEELLIDSSFLYAIHDQGDKYHQRAIRFASSYEGKLLVPEVTLVEVSQMLYRFSGQIAVLSFLDAMDNPSILLQSVTADDVKRARHIMAAYNTANLDLVDCFIVALAERLNISQICTFDRRDFAMVRPAHAQFLELLP